MTCKYTKFWRYVTDDLMLIFFSIRTFISHYLFDIIVQQVKMGTRPSKLESLTTSDIDDLNGFCFGSQFVAEELVSHILLLGDVKTIKCCRLVCKQWNELISNRYFWKKKALAESKHWPNVPLEETVPWSFYANIYLNQPFERNLIKNPCGKGWYHILVKYLLALCICMFIFQNT